MKRIVLDRLRLVNFKGVRDFTLEPSAEGATVFGTNATGKSSLADAWGWLLFGKDSRGASQFAIKPIDGAPESSVEATLDVDGKAVRLRKVYREKWTKTRGRSAKVFAGHVTDHFVDDVPMKKRDFEQRVAEVATDEATFRLLSDPTAFANLRWTDRRDLLLALIDDVSDEDVVETNPEFAEVPDLLDGRSVDDVRKVVQAERRKVNEELGRIPVRVDEALRGRPETPSGDPEAWSAKVAEHDETLERLRAELRDLQSDDGRSALRRKVDDAKAALARAEAGARQSIEDAKAEARRVERERADLARAHEAASKRIAALRAEHESTSERLAAKRAEWLDVRAETYAPPEAGEECPTCGRPLEGHDPEAHRAAWNEARAKRLDEIQADGKRLADRLDEIAREIEAEHAEVAKIEGVQRPEAPEHVPTLEDFPDVLSAREVLEIAEDALAADEPDRSAEEAKRAEISTEEAKRREAAEAVAALDAAKRADARVAELEAEERSLAKAVEEQDRRLNLLDEFTRARVSMIETRVGEAFDLVSFQLFEEQVNGGLAETCIITIDGVPFDSLNGAARTNAGLDIIRALQAHHEIVPPVFVDNAEAVVDLAPTRGQVIRLVVSASDATLRVEEGIAA